jgi:hypothetical protein
MILARRQRLPGLRLIAFTVIMLGSLTLGILLYRTQGLDTLLGSILIFNIALMILTATFFRKQFFTPYFHASGVTKHESPASSPDRRTAPCGGIFGSVHRSALVPADC